MGILGLRDTPENRQILADALGSTFRNIYNIAETEIVKSQGSLVIRYVKDDVLSGPGGTVKMATIWEGSRLITIFLFGKDGGKGNETPF